MKELHVLCRSELITEVGATYYRTCNFNPGRQATYIVTLIKAGFHMIADNRGSQIAKSSAIVCDDMETRICDRLRSSAIVCDQLRSCDHMETKVLRSAIEPYPIIF